ncbi:MAG TPA: metallophosphoesterase [Kofleriaceae bacterium]|jgi:hypothetical protein
MTRFAILALALAACGKHATDEHPAAGSAAAVAARPASGCGLPELPLRRPPAKRVVAIGDIHGDVDAARAALRAAGAIDDHDAWIGGDLVVVQTGDVLDRNDTEQEALDLFAKLEVSSNGAFIPLLGNHELMNAAGDYRYVTPGGKKEFGGDRAAALGPGGTYAKHLASHAVVTIVGDTVFSHAGVLPDWVSRLDAVNADTRCWLAGAAGDAQHPPAALTDDNSPVWTRAYGGDPADCASLKTALASLGATRMVVAHTVQKAGISSACDGALWRIDVGLGREYGGPIQVLELVPGAAPRVLTGTRL